MAGETHLQLQKNTGTQIDPHLNYVIKKPHSLEKPRLTSCGKVLLIQVSKNQTFKGRLDSSFFDLIFDFWNNTTKVSCLLAEDYPLQ